MYDMSAYAQAWIFYTEVVSLILCTSQEYEPYTMTLLCSNSDSVLLCFPSQYEIIHKRCIHLVGRDYRIEVRSELRPDSVVEMMLAELCAIFMFVCIVVLPSLHLSAITN